MEHMDLASAFLMIVPQVSTPISSSKLSLFDAVGFGGEMIIILDILVDIKKSFLSFLKFICDKFQNEFVLNSRI